MIPTWFKSKLPNTLSYPAGAQLLSDGLRGIPQFDQFVVRFQGRPMFSATDFNAMLKSGQPYVVLEAHFTKSDPSLTSPRSMIESGDFEAKWELTVYPVLRQYRHAAQAALEAIALPNLRQWLSHPKAQTWKSGYRRREFVFHPSAATLTVNDFGNVFA